MNNSDLSLQLMGYRHGSRSRGSLLPRPGSLSSTPGPSIVPPLPYKGVMADAIVDLLGQGNKDTRALLHGPVPDAVVLFKNSFKSMLKSKRDITTVESLGKIDGVTYMCDYVAVVLDDLIIKYGTDCVNNTSKEIEQHLQDKRNEQKATIDKEIFDQKWYPRGRRFTTKIFTTHPLPFSVKIERLDIYIQKTELDGWRKCKWGKTLLKKFIEDEERIAYGDIGMYERQAGELTVVSVDNPLQLPRFVDEANAPYKWANPPQEGRVKGKDFKWTGRYEISLLLKDRDAPYVVRLEADNAPKKFSFPKKIKKAWNLLREEKLVEDKLVEDKLVEDKLVEDMCKKIQEKLPKKKSLDIPELSECYVACWEHRHKRQDERINDGRTNIKKYNDTLFRRRYSLRTKFLNFLQSACAWKGEQMKEIQPKDELTREHYPSVLQDEDAKRMYEITNIFMNLSQPLDSNALITLIDRNGMYKCHRFVNNVECNTINTVTDGKEFGDDNKYTPLDHNLGKYVEGKSSGSSADKWETLSRLPKTEEEELPFLENERLGAVLSVIRSVVGGDPENVLSSWLPWHAMVPPVLRKRYHLLKNENSITRSSFLDFPLKK